MFIAMQIYKEGERTFFNKVSAREYKTLQAAINCAKTKGKGIPYVVQGQKIVWSALTAKVNMERIQARGHLN